MNFIRNHFLSQVFDISHSFSRLITAYLPYRSFFSVKIFWILLLFCAQLWILKEIISYHKSMTFLTAFHVLSLLIYLIAHFSAWRYFEYCFIVPNCEFYQNSFPITSLWHLSQLFTSYHCLSTLSLIFQREDILNIVSFLCSIVNFIRNHFLSQVFDLSHSFSRLITAYRSFCSVKIFWILLYCTQLWILSEFISYHKSLTFLTAFHVLSLLIYLIAHFSAWRYFEYCFFFLLNCEF